MTAINLEQAIENIYASVNNDNEDLDVHISALKAALGGTKDVTMDPTRLTHNNREGRKLMQSFFKKRGIVIKFTAKE
ncbi:MAG: hypothetical protein KKA05_03325 [Alphaproteobacteria bacterium]|nr:hypothetical protein [Alphaproteobacteria bacterium]MBU0858486.1 hypothetical protein [Alphaproteobacteria bacterium]